MISTNRMGCSQWSHPGKARRMLNHDVTCSICEERKQIDDDYAHWLMTETDEPFRCNECQELHPYVRNES